MINHGEVDVLGVAILRHRRKNHHANKVTRNFLSKNVSVDRLKDGDFFGDVEVRMHAGVPLSSLRTRKGLRCHLVHD